MSSKNRGRDRTITTTPTATTLSKVIMSEQNTKEPVAPVTPATELTPKETPETPVAGDTAVDIIDATAGASEEPDVTTKEEALLDDTEAKSGSLEDSKATEVPVAELEASDAASATAALEPIAPATIEPELDVIAPPVELAVQPIQEGEALPPYLARQRGYLDDYARVMGRDNRPSSQEMGIQQRNLYQVLVMLFDLDGSDFITALDDLLKFINQHREFMFSDKYIFRAMDVIAVDYAGTQVFKQLMILLVKIADPADRALIRNHLDLNTAVRGVRNGERALALITEFLNI